MRQPLAAGYEEILGRLRELTGALPPAAVHKLLGENAVRVHRLPDGAG